MYLYANAAPVDTKVRRGGDGNVYVELGSFGFVVMTDVEAARFSEAMIEVLAIPAGSHLPLRHTLDRGHKVPDDRTEFTRDDEATGL